MKSILMLTISVASISLSAQSNELNVAANTASDDTAAVKAVVEDFLRYLGEGDLEKVKAQFLPNANIGSVVMREGTTKIYTSTFDEFIAKRESGRNFKEPVRTFTVNISQGMLAFVRADATVVIDDIPSHFTNDFFILMKDHGEWKFLSGSYTSFPLEENE